MSIRHVSDLRSNLLLFPILAIGEGWPSILLRSGTSAAGLRSRRCVGYDSWTREPAAEGDRYFAGLKKSMDR